MSTKQQILSEEMSLSAEEREGLADELWRSVERANGNDVDSAWAEEAERRIDQLDSGKVQANPGEQVMEEARQISKGDRSRQ